MPNLRLKLATTVFAALPLLGQTFEVASIKPAPPPDGRGMTVGSKGGPGTDDPGLYSGLNLNLTNLVSIAFDVPHYRLTAPDWMQSARFNVSARVPAGTTKEQFKLMFQNLLIERFKLAVHREKKEMQVFDLVAPKGEAKLARAAGEPPKDPDAEPAKKPAGGPLKLGADGYPALAEGTTQGMMNGRARIRYPRETMESFSGTLSSQLGRPVIDMTGLTGKYDISLYWDMRGSSEPDAGPSLIIAIQEQLGLKLESKKGSVEFLVVDHAEKVPTDN